MQEELFLNPVTGSLARNEEAPKMGVFLCLCVVGLFHGIIDHRLGVTFESELTYGNGLNILWYIIAAKQTHEMLLLLLKLLQFFQLIVLCW